MSPSSCTGRLQMTFLNFTLPPSVRWMLIHPAASSFSLPTFTCLVFSLSDILIFSIKLMEEEKREKDNRGKGKMICVCEVYICNTHMNTHVCGILHVHGK